MQGLFHVVRAVVAVDVAATLVADRYVVVVAAVLLALAPLACVSDCVWRQSSVLTGVAILVVVVVVVVVVIAVSSSNSRSRISRHWQWY